MTGQAFANKMAKAFISNLVRAIYQPHGYQVTPISCPINVLSL